MPTSRVSITVLLLAATAVPLTAQAPADSGRTDSSKAQSCRCHKGSWGHGWFFAPHFDLPRFEGRDWRFRYEYRFPRFRFDLGRDREWWHDQRAWARDWAREQGRMQRPRRFRTI